MAYTLVVLVEAPHATFEDLHGEGCAMFCFRVSSVREMGNDVSKLDICARVQEICKCVRCLVCRGGVYLVVLRLSKVFGVPPPMRFGCLYALVLLFVWRSEARFKEVVLWVFGVRELCVWACDRPVCL